MYSKNQRGERMIQTRQITKKKTTTQYYVICPYTDCKREIKGTSVNMVDHNLQVHVMTHHRKDSHNNTDVKGERR